MGLLDFLQSASNTAAGNVSAPVDGIAWLLRKAGVPVGDSPVGGSDWMEKQGLTRPVQQSAASLAGETVGLLGPMVAAAKAPQIAGGLLQAADNASIPTKLNKQVGAINVKALQEQFPTVDFSLMQRGNQATLSKVVVPREQRGQGVGTEFMQALTKAADSDGTQLALSPSSDFGGNKAKLVEFYKRFGFVPNKGKSIDFSISESMRREPNL